jgi:hypothetical protein
LLKQPAFDEEQENMSATAAPLQKENTPSSLAVGAASAPPSPAALAEQRRTQSL